MKKSKLLINCITTPVIQYLKKYLIIKNVSLTSDVMTAFLSSTYTWRHQHGLFGSLSASCLQVLYVLSF